MPAARLRWPRSNAETRRLLVSESAGQPRVRVDPTTDAGVAVVWLNRPEVLNALDYATLGDLVDALGTLDGDPAVRCVVITGAGERAFAAGADIREMADATPVSLSVTNNFA